MTAEVCLLGPGDEAVLVRVAEGVFDDPIDPAAARAFLNDPRHHIAVAVADGVVVGFVSAVHYVHPDKPSPELWINEVSVGEAWRRAGLASRMLEAMLERARALGCSEAWVLTDRANAPAMGLYASLGGEADTGETVMFSYRLSPPGT